MTDLATRMPAAPESTPVEPGAGPSRVGARDTLWGVGVLVTLTAVVVVLSLWHLTQGTSGVGPIDLARWLLGGEDVLAPSGVTIGDLIWGSRLPRLAAAIVVGFALGVAGCLFQSIARNPLASPDTLAVTGGAYLAVTAVAAFGITLPLWASGLSGFIGGSVTALLVLSLAGAGSSTSRLILAGSAVAMATQAATATLLILFQEETTSLFAWGNGSLTQLGFGAVNFALPLVVVAFAGALWLARSLDVLSLGEDTAASLGVPVRRIRAGGVLIAVVLTAAAVTVAGPIGFVGLVAPVLVRAAARVVPGLRLHAFALPASGLLGVIVVIAADAVVRAALGAEEGLRVPPGVTTTILGGILMIALARSHRGFGGSASSPTARRLPGRLGFTVVLTVLVALVVTLSVVGLLAGHTWLRFGDLGLWLNDSAGPLVGFALDERAPRVGAALAAGAALALAGVLVQGTCRNPLAEPGLLGITGGAGLGAVLIVTGGGNHAPSSDQVLIAGVLGALASFGLVYALAWRGGLDADRLVLIGIGVWYSTTAISTFLLVRSNPWDTPRIYTWLSGTTYGRTWDQVLPVAAVLLLAIPLAFVLRRELDLLALDDDVPRGVGVALEPVRLAILLLGALLAATSVAAVGVVGFVGLVAPHAARALVGSRHVRVIPTAIGIGAALMVLADLLGRTVIAPAQIPVGLLVSLIGTPYFIWLLSRSRAG
ncbi:iron ABC transporter permease [Nocardioides sp. Bht2]|uniref:iron ABC transporter permease n=1 Tax=Nocardioides sp. Bht2 TaxID=3392297 RepID=UPI0039B5EA78